VAQYGDSLQQTGFNIGNNGAVAPRNIEISSMTFQSAEVTDVFLVEDATQCWFDSVNFVGPLTASDIIDNTSTDDIAGVRFSSTVSLTTSDITFDKCGFQGLTYGINTSEVIQSITVSNSGFDTLYQGIVLDGGNPTGFRALHNIFDNIYAEGIVYADAILNVSGYNLFMNVGYSIGSSSPITPVITFNNDNNLSVGDLFQRTDDDALIEPRIDINTTSSTSGGTLIQLGRYAREAGRTFTLVNNQSNQDIYSINVLQTKAFDMTYTIVRGPNVRHGVLTVVTGPSDDSSVDTSYNEDYTENFDTGVTFSVTKSSDIVTVEYTTTNTGINGTLTYSLSHLA
jgi:hypothetical protein